MKYIIGGIVVLALIFFIFFHKKQAPVTEVLPSQEAQTSTKEPEAQAPAASEQKNETEQSAINKKEVKNGMTIEVLKEGSGPEIKNGQTAVMQYTGMFPNGEVFDATSKRGNQPFSFILGSGMVIKGWDEGVLGMKVGESRKFTIPPELAYGERGIPGAIPPNATLIFEVTLEAIK